MRRKKLLRQVAAAAVALSMAVSLSAPAFAATFDLSNGGLVITANDKGITVEQDDGTSSTIGKDEEIEIIGSYGCSSSESSSGSGSSSDTYRALDAEEKLSDPQQKEKSTNAPANGELNASAGERQEPKAEDEGQPKPEAVASTSASTSASDDASNGPREAQARSSGEGERSSEGERRGIIQIFANTLVKLKLKDATIDQPNAADTTTRGMAAIDIQGSGNVEIKVEGNNTLNGYGNSAGIQKNDDVSTGKLTITAEDKNQTLNVIADVRGAAIGGSGWGWNEGSNSQHGTKNIEINGGTVNTQGRIGGGYKGGAAENIVIKGDAVVNANGGIGGGTDEGYEGNEGRQTSITISGNAQVNATYKVDTKSDYGDKYGFGGDNAGLAVIGGGVGSSSKKSHAKVTIEGNAQVTAENRAYGGGAGIGGGANGKGHVTIGGSAQVKATGSAEKHGGSGAYGAGAAIGDGGTTGKKGTDTVQNGKNEFTTDKGIQDGAKVEMTNIGHNGPNTVTQTRQNGEWVTDGKTEQPPEKCKHSQGEYAAERVSPTCTEKGSQTYRCSSCGEIIRVEELAPDFGFWSHDRQTVTVQPTCTEDGYKVTKCGRCHQELGSHYSIVKALGHQFVETTVAPTCTESGYTVSKCTRCHEEEGERTNLVAPLGHEYKNGVCIRCGAPEPQENGSAAPNYTVTGAETYETSVVDGRYIIAVPSEDAALSAVLGDLRAIKAQGADVVVFRTRSRESSLVIDEMLAMGTDVTPFVLTHNGGEAQLTINGAAHNELIH